MTKFQNTNFKTPQKTPATRKAALLLALAIILAGTALAQKPTVSVMDLSVTSGLTQQEALMLTDKLLNDLVTDGTFKVVERSKRDEILKEQGFQQTGACDASSCLVEAGQLLGVQKMIGGTMGKLGEMYSLQLRVIDIKTGEVDMAFSKSYSGDISLLLHGMREAAMSFSGLTIKPLQDNIASERMATEIDGLLFLQINSQGYKEYLNVKDSSVLIEIPAGHFLMGFDNSREYDDNKPIRTVYLSKYYISKYEVTEKQYRKFCKATGRTISKKININKNNYPIDNVDWNSAEKYCEWAGLRLPTEAEWEKAARGVDGRKYPWGDTWDVQRSCGEKQEDGTTTVTSVGSYPLGISPFGCYDMAGNVWEWCNDWYGKDYYSIAPTNNPQGPTTGNMHVMRGGPWLFLGFCRTFDRNSNTIEGKIGFRCAK